MTSVSISPSKRDEKFSETSTQPAVNMAFVPVAFSKPQLLPPLLCSRRLYVHIALLIVTICILVLIRIMTQVKVTFVHYHLESDTDAELVTLPKTFAFPRGAHCLDGSPPAYYYRPSPVVAVSFWLIYLPGDSWCISEEDCFQRSLTELGSSHVARTSLSLNGILSSSCDVNPDFCLWNVVIFHYCDGASFLGNHSKVLSYESQPLYLRGAIVFDTVMDYLRHTTPLGNAEQIVLAGSSAGGVAALIHADRLRSRLPQSVKTLHVVADSTLFVDTVSIDGKHTLAHIFRSMYKLHSMNASASIQECSQNKRPELEWTCLLPAVYHSYVFTPAFFSNSIYDTWLRTHALKVPCFAVSCPGAHLDTVYQARDAVRELANIIIKSKKNGIFLTWCPVHSIINSPWFSDQILGTPTLQKAVAHWLQTDEGHTNFDVVLDIEPAVEKCMNIMNPP